MYKPFYKNEKGKITLNRIELDLLIDSLFIEVDNASDIDFIEERLIGAVEMTAEYLHEGIEEE